MRELPKYRRLLFLLIGALVLVIAYFVTDPSKRGEFWTSTLQNVALIALTVVIVEFLWDLAGGDPVAESFQDVRTALAELRQSVTLLNDSHRTGLRRVVAASIAIGSDFWLDRLRSATRKVELMGYTLRIWTKTPNFERIVVQQARDGVRFKLLLMSPDNPQLAAFVNHRIPGLSVAGVRQEILDTIVAFKAIQARLAGTDVAKNFELRLVQEGLIVTQICRFDDALTVVQYLYSQEASRTPFFDIAGGKSDLFRIYVEEFDHLWDVSVAA